MAAPIDTALEGLSNLQISSPPNTDAELARHMKYLHRPPQADQASEAASSPLFTSAARQALRGESPQPQVLFPQSSLLGCEVSSSKDRDARVFYNVAAPSSLFICGSQGSGKSHTLSCVLEGCLMASEVSEVPRPLAGVVFHYDTFISDRGGAPCEAAYLASGGAVKVRVLCAPTNYRAMQETYKAIPEVSVQKLQLSSSDLNTQRMLDLMAVGDGNMPLYLHVLQRILREMRIEQQQQTDWQGASFKYGEFKRRLLDEKLTGQQMSPLQQRLDTLESFMVKEHTSSYRRRQSKEIPPGTDWKPVAGQLTIVDLSCPCVTPEMACSLFNICLSLFLEQDQASPQSATPPIGRIVALDEAHKYLSSSTSVDEGTPSAECRTLTNTLLSTIRLQRHLGVRVVISTQEPSVSPKLLDLCSATLVHRFSSPAWEQMLCGHLAGASLEKEDGGSTGTKKDKKDLFRNIVNLKVGEAFLFAPSALVGVRVGADGDDRGEGESDGLEGSGGMAVRRLGDEILKIRVRNRVTADGGKSILAE
ncbi:hypothetical protein F4810DRAFT_372079 [Camillea tinctor]|nr:hypothetical protein F4810DRAFT_372079 [Camillea tinctor]